MSKVVAITGGIGVGKTFVSTIFYDLAGIPCFHSDTEAKKIMNNSSVVKKKIISIVGPNCYINNKLNTQYLKNKIFSSKTQLKKINELVHNEVKINFKNWLNIQSSRYVLKETAILFEHRYHDEVDLSILVTAPMKLRLKRICKRDNVSKKTIEQIIDNQLDDKIKLGLCDFFIENIDKKQTMQRVKRLIKTFSSI